MTPQLASWLPTLILAPLIGFLLYRRLRRSFGRQEVAPPRMIARMVLLSVFGLLLLAVWLPTPTGIGAALAGLSLGIALSAVGLAHTTFEVNADKKFYVPNKWIGLAITALVLGRLAGRLFTISQRTAHVARGATPPAGLYRSPLTVGLFFLLAGYYVSYYAGVLRRARALSTTPSSPNPSHWP